MELTPQNVDDVFRACCVGRPSETGGLVKIEGVMSTFYLIRDRVAERRDDIKSLLGQLDRRFAKGWSFLQACDTAKGVLWTGDHAVVERLLVMGEAAELVHLCLARDKWDLLAGNMPYYRIDKEVFEK